MTNTSHTNPKFLFNRKDTAEFFGVTGKSLDEWGLPRKKVGREAMYNLKEVFEFRLDMLCNQGKLDLVQEQAKLAKSRRAKIDLEFQARRGQLIERYVVENDAFATGRTIRDNILNIADRLAGTLAAETSQERRHALISKELIEALEGIANAPYV